MTNTHTKTQSTTTTDTVFVYFISIQHFAPSGIGFFNMEMPLSVEITTLADVQFVEGFMRKQGYNSALVMGYSLLRTEPAQDRGRS